MVGGAVNGSKDRALSSESERGLAGSPSSRVDRLDMSLFDQIRGGCASYSDRRSLLALHAALAARGEFRYLEVGSYHGASLQPFIADPRCRRIVSIDRRDESAPDERFGESRYPSNTPAEMLERLAAVPGADLSKLSTVEAGTDDVDAAELTADLCLIDAQHTNDAALSDARFCYRAVRGRGVIVFHDRIAVDRGIQRFLEELSSYRAYPLAHDMFVVEIDVPSLLTDPRVRAQVPHAAWLAAERLRVVRPALALAPLVRLQRRAFARSALTLGAPHRRRRVAPSMSVATGAPFEIHTFVDSEALYQRMRESFVAAGFSPDGFVRLADGDDDPYAAVTRIGQESTARYPILSHQDVLADQGAGAAELLAALRRLDVLDPRWIVAGNAGVMRSGRLLRRLVDGHGGSTGEPLPLPAVTLDENFLVFNRRNPARCSADISGFHLYGADVCLQALALGGTSYVIDFPVTHTGRGTTSTDYEQAYWREYERAAARFTAAWNRRSLFRYVITPSDAFFVSRSRLLRRAFGSSRALAAVTQCREERYRRPLRMVDRMSAIRLPCG